MAANMGTRELTIAVFKLSMETSLNNSFTIGFCTTVISELYPPNWFVGGRSFAGKLFVPYAMQENLTLIQNLFWMPSVQRTSVEPTVHLVGA